MGKDSNCEGEKKREEMRGGEDMGIKEGIIAILGSRWAKHSQLQAGNGGGRK